MKADTSISNIAVKMRFEYDNGINGEHLWFDDLHLKGKILYGVLENDPLHVKAMHKGDTVEVLKQRLSDWMFVKDGKLNGGFTTKVLYSKMTKEEQQEFRSQYSYDIE